MSDHRERDPFVSFVNVTKDFGANRVLDNVSLDFYPGSIHAVLGANGSGKSTLMKILAGYHSPSSGDVLVKSENMAGKPNWSVSVRESGVRFVHQDLGLVGGMSVLDNMGLTSGFAAGFLGISWRKQRQNVMDDLAAVGLSDVNPETLVRDLGPIQQTLVAIARATKEMGGAGGCLVLDEPTARLPNDQVEELSVRCRSLRDRGVALIYISHRLDEVFSLADTVSVLRDGQLVMAQNPTSKTSVSELTEVITGTVSAESGLRISPDFADTQTTQQRAVEPALEAVGLSGARVSDVNFRLYPGEILAVTGLAGSGRSELGRLLFGSQPVTAGAVKFKGEDVSETLSPNESMARGMGYIPQDRKQALVSTLNVTENLTLATIKNYLRGIGLSAKSTRAFAEGAIEDFDVRPADPDRKIGELSGGNQQKVVLGKWLAIQPTVLILDECTYGVDVGARQGIMKIVADRVAGGGLAVLLIDSDIDLISTYAGRVLIMQDGRFVGEIIGDDITPASIAAASYAVLETTQPKE